MGYIAGMKKGIFGNKWIRDEDGKVYGVSLGYSPAVEHETGIFMMRKAFGVAKAVVEGGLPEFGIGARTIKTNPAVYFESGDNALIGYTSGNSDYLKTYLKDHNSEFAGYWSENSFCLVSSDKAALQLIWRAFNALDVAMFTGNYEPDGGAGLNIVIASRVPDQVKVDMRNKDESAYELGEAFRTTGIEDKLRAAEKHYYAIRPQWTDDTKTEMKFWINPYDQQKYNHGWYTMEDLEAWMRGEGPIIKKEEPVDNND